MRCIKGMNFKSLREIFNRDNPSCKQHREVDIESTRNKIVNIVIITY